MAAKLFFLPVVFLSSSFGIVQRPVVLRISVPPSQRSAAERGPPNYQTEPRFAEEDRKSGAVLCSLMITLDMKAYSHTCRNGADIEIESALDDSIQRIHRFVAANSNTKMIDLERQSRDYVERSKELHICGNDGRQFYQMITKGGAAGICEGTDKLLAVPRPPVLNPCL